MTVVLYDKKRIIELTFGESYDARTWNLPMNSNDFRIFKDVQNDVEFVVRNTDRKPVNLAGRTAKINLFDQNTGTLLHQQELIVTDELKGYCRLVLLPDVTADWFLQTYSYSVQVTNENGATFMLYTDQAQSQTGFFELAQGPIFDPRPSYEVEYDNLSTTDIWINNNDTLIRYSSAFPGSLQRNNTTGVHTVAAYLNNFTGTFKIQGALDIAVPLETSWFDIEVNQYDHLTSIETWTFEANLNWVRFWLINRYDQTNGQPVLESDVGSISKIVLRN